MTLGTGLLYGPTGKVFLMSEVPQQVVHMMLVTQYLDVLKEFALSGRATMVRKSVCV